MNHRSDIDGLRAIAIIPVILYHAGISTFGGGFTGVDVFFVISGYLITSLLTRDLDVDDFSIVKFYERRARRILPALIAVLFASTVAAWIIIPPVEMVTFCKSVLATITFSSNIYFWKTSGYFSAAAETTPLLHTWSLAVEEQFYICFPILLATIIRSRKRILTPVLAAIVIVSLSVSEWGVSRTPSATFFLIPSRAWELCVGSLAALISNHAMDRRLSDPAANAASVLGMVLVCTPFFIYSDSTPFPGLHAAPSVFGAALIILFSRPTGLVYRALSQKMLTHVGLISYSAYLWHQPILAFAKELSPEPNSLLQVLALSAGSFVVAHVCWKHLEQPTRNRTLVSTRKLLIWIAATLMVLLIFNMLGILNRGFEERLSEPAKSFFSGEHNTLKRINCHSTPQNPIAPGQACIEGNTDHVIAALVGDSHAFGISGMLGREFNNGRFGYLQLTADGCPPATDLYRKDDPNYNASCIKHNIDTYDLIRNHGEIKYIVIFAIWHHWLQNADSNAPQDAQLPTRTARVSSAFMRQIQQYVQLNRKVILVYPTPEFDTDVPHALWAAHVKNMAFANIYAPPAHHQNRRELEDFFAQAAKIKGVIATPVNDLFCKKSATGRETCQVSDNNAPLYFDTHHLTENGAERVARAIANQIKISEQALTTSHAK